MQRLLSFLLLLGASFIFAQKINIDSLKSVIKSELRDELAQKKPDSAERARLLQWSKFSIRGYGAFNYYKFGRFDTDKGIRNKVDAERLNLYLDYHFNDKLKLNTEIEFEHGGTGSTMELDVQEEFGEYEQEVEQGGEVKLEQLNIEYAYRPYLHIKAGKLKVLFNISQKLDDSDEYFTTTLPEMENTILPLGWYEMGVEASGTFWKNRLSYHAAIVNGLDSSGFSSGNWIKGGYQTKFEMANAENFAFFGNIDYKIGTHRYSLFGVSYYQGETSGNRPKPDLAVKAGLKLYGAHLAYYDYPYRFSSQFIYGELQNSENISIRNANLSANLETKKTPVAKNAMGFSAEFGYDILHLIAPSSRMRFYPFARYDFYDTMYKTAGSITDNKRWERSTITGGFNLFFNQYVMMKMQYAHRTLGSDNVDISTGIINGKQKENTFSTGIAFEF